MEPPSSSPSSSDSVVTPPRPPSSAPSALLKILGGKITDSEKLLKTIAKRDEEAGEKRSAEIAEKEAEISRRDAALAEKEAEIARRGAEIAEREAEISRKDAALAGKDSEIRRLLRKRKRDGEDGDDGTAPAFKKTVREVKDTFTQTDQGNATTASADSFVSAKSTSLSTVHQFCQTDDSNQPPPTLLRQQASDKGIASNIQPSGSLLSAEEHHTAGDRVEIAETAPEAKANPLPPPSRIFSDNIRNSPCKKRAGPIINFFAKKMKRRRNPVIRFTRRSYLTSDFTNLAATGKWQRVMSSMTTGFLEPDALELGVKAIRVPIKTTLLSPKAHMKKSPVKATKPASRSPAAKKNFKAETKKILQERLKEQKRQSATKKVRSPAPKIKNDSQSQTLESKAESEIDDEMPSVSTLKKKRKKSSFLESSDDDDTAKDNDVIEDEGAEPREIPTSKAKSQTPRKERHKGIKKKEATTVSKSDIVMGNDNVKNSERSSVSEQKEQKVNKSSEQHEGAPAITPKQQLPQLFALGTQKPAASNVDIRAQIRAAVEARTVKKSSAATTSRTAIRNFADGGATSVQQRLARSTPMSNPRKLFGRLPMSLIEPKVSVEKSRPKWLEKRKITRSEPTAKIAKVENGVNKVNDKESRSPVKKPISPKKSISLSPKKLDGLAPPQIKSTEKEKDIPMPASTVVEKKVNDIGQVVQEDNCQGMSHTAEEKGTPILTSSAVVETSSAVVEIKVAGIETLPMIAGTDCNVAEKKEPERKQESEIVITEVPRIPEGAAPERDHLKVTEKIATADHAAEILSPENVTFAYQTKIGVVKLSVLPGTVATPCDTESSSKFVSDMPIEVSKGPEQMQVCLAEVVPQKSSQPATLLEEMSAKYRSLNASKVDALKTRKEGLQRSFLRETFVNCLKIQMGRLWAAADEPTFQSIVDQLSKPEFAGPFERLLFDMLYMAVRDEKPPVTADGNHSSSSSQLFNFDDGMAALTAKQIKVIALLDRLSKTETLRGVGSRFSKYYYYSIFGANKMYNMKGYQAANVVRFYLTLLRQTENEEAVRTFLYDIFFFRNARNHVFICILLDVWPEVLYWFGYRTQEQERAAALDPVVETVVWLVYHEAPASSLNDLRVHEARKRLRDQCNVRMPQMTAVELVQKFISQVLEDCNNEVLKEASTKSLLLLSKVKDYRWANNNVQALLVELLGKNQNKPELILWIVETIASISRVYPKDGRDLLMQMFEGVKGNLTDCLNPKTQNVCLTALLRLGHHLQMQVAGFLNSWKPAFPLSPDVELLLINYLGTRGKRHGETTIIVQKKKRIFAKV